MPYRDPERQREYMKEWRVANAQRVASYQRAAVLSSAMKGCRFPTPKSVQRHGLTEEELVRVVASMLSVQQQSACAR